ncbi:hypothetical protein FHG87_014212 [Trinorchestia longiramus]|nr:hypothetical protein FHG87_014212 [Trinorchestia longiramus]
MVQKWMAAVVLVLAAVEGAVSGPLSHPHQEDQYLYSDGTQLRHAPAWTPGAVESLSEYPSSNLLQSSPGASVDQLSEVPDDRLAGLDLLNRYVDLSSSPVSVSLFDSSNNTSSSNTNSTNIYSTNNNSSSNNNGSSKNSNSYTNSNINTNNSNTNCSNTNSSNTTGKSNINNRYNNNNSSINKLTTAKRLMNRSGRNSEYTSSSTSTNNTVRIYMSSIMC